MNKLLTENEGIVGGSELPVTSHRAFFGSVALSVVNFGRIAVQMAVLPILARLLGPEAFGLVFLAMPFILFSNMLSDGGMGAALVRRGKPSPEVESTVFWLSIGIGTLLATGLWLLAEPAAQLLHQPRLTAILRVLSPILILSSSLSVSNSRIARARHFSLFAIGDTLSLTLSSGAAVAAAVGGLGAWSLVIQQLVLWTAKCAWILPASGFRPKLVCKPHLSRDLLAFGLNNVGANIADFLGKSAPALVIGAEVGVIAVGHYSMAYQLVRMPEFVLSGPLFLATFTAIAVLHEAKGEPVGLALRTLRMTVAILAPLFCGLACVSDLLVAVFLGSRWHAAAPVLAALAPAGFFMCLYSVAGAVLMGFGRSDLQFRLSLICGLCMLVGVALGAHFGLVWAAAGVSLGAAAASPFYLAKLSTQLGAGARERLLANFTGPVVSSVAMVAVLSLGRLALSHADRRLELASLVLLGVAVYAASMTLTSGRQLVEDIRRILPDRAPRLAA